MTGIVAVATGIVAVAVDTVDDGGAHAGGVGSRSADATYSRI